MTSTASTTAPRPGVRERLVEAAERLFHADGIRAVGVDRLCGEAQVSKRSLYQHFAGKDAVVTAMLEAEAAQFRDRLGGGGTPRERVLAVFDAAAAAADRPEPRGCPFVSAATELKDPDHPAAQVARTAKLALAAWFTARAREAGAAEPELLGQQLTLVFDGLSAHAVVQGTSTPAARRAVETLLAAAGM